MKNLIRMLIRPFWSLGTQVVLLWNHTKAGKTLITTEYELRSAKIPEEFQDFVIVQLTDLHGRCFRNKQMEIVEKVESLGPDIVVMTGDMFSHAHDRDGRLYITNLMRELAQRWPVYASLGNHEMRDHTLDDIDMEMREAGVILLRNQAEILHRGSGRLGIAGVDADPMRQLYADETQEERMEKLEETLKRYKQEPVDFQILLAHRPELLKDYAQTGVDLVFSGHAHGGLLALPFTKDRRLLAPGQGFFPKYTQGLYKEKDTLLVLSSGLGGPRFGLKPEIVRVKFTKSFTDDDCVELQNSV